jgi:glycosyltransferase involved in cell wall biosynthesis
MKIVHVTQFLGIGGLEKIIFHIITEQLSLGHDVSLYVYDYDQEWVPYFRKHGIHVITPPLKKPGYDLKLLRQMRNDLQDYDVVHTHDLNPLLYLAPIYFFGKIFFKKLPKLIHTTHGLGHIERHPRYKTFERVIIPLTHKVIGVSEKIGKFYSETLHVSEEKVRVIENGVDVYKAPITQSLRAEKKSWLCARHNLDSTRPLLLSLSRVLPLKDQLFLIEAIKKRPDYQLVIVGPPSDQAYYDQLKKLEDKNIILVGAQELVSDYNMGSDLYVSASTHEGIPVAVLEAMAVETPCLVSDIPGHRTLLQEGKSIEIFELQNQAQFLELCDRLLSDKEAAHQQALVGKSIVEKYFSVKKMVHQYMLEYES